MSTSELPPVLPPKRLKMPTTSERTLDSGLRVVAVRTPGLPLAEVRLRLPLPALAGSKGAAEDALREVLTETIVQGTTRRPGSAVAEDLRDIGGSLGAASDSDSLVVNGSGLSAGLGTLLEILADVLTGAEHSKVAVASSRERFAQEIAIARTMPGLVARTAMARRAFGDHPYSRGLPTDEMLAAVKASKVRALHAQRIVPAEAVLVIVSDLTTRRALDLAERALSGWTGGRGSKPPPSLPTPQAGPMWVVHRPGAVQSNLRLAGAGLPRDHAEHAALRMAVTVFGGYFTSRLVSNIREDKGYTYSPGSSLNVRAAGPSISVAADVATAVTAAALLETTYELGRMATLPVEQEELDAARQYVLGTTALSLASQSGLASTLVVLLSQGLDLTWLEGHRRDLLAVTREQVLSVSSDHLAPARLVAAVVGDADAITGSLSGLGVLARVDIEA